jgi:hypothetical protein
MAETHSEWGRAEEEVLQFSRKYKVERGRRAEDNKGRTQSCVTTPSGDI